MRLRMLAAGEDQAAGGGSSGDGDVVAEAAVAGLDADSVDGGHAQ